jgi:hypothetical protein
MNNRELRNESGPLIPPKDGIFLVRISAHARSTFVDTQGRIEYSHDVSKRA